METDLVNDTIGLFTTMSSLLMAFYFGLPTLLWVSLVLSLYQLGIFLNDSIAAIKESMRK